MLGLEEFSRVVAQVHATAGVPHRWEEALTTLARSIDADGCTLAIGEGRDRTIFSTSLDAEAVSTYDSYYHRMDFVMATCESDPVGLVRGHWDLVEANKRSEFHNDWQRRFELSDGLTVRLSSTTPASLVMSAPLRNEPFETKERLRFVNALVPHLRSALASRQQITDSCPGCVDISDSLDVVRHAMFIVKSGGKIVRMNTAGQSAAKLADGITVRADCIRAFTPASDTELQTAIANALPSARANSPRRGAVVVVYRPSGQRPYVVRVVPLDAAVDPLRARAAVIVIDPAQTLTPSKDLLQKLFSFTATEYEVAARMLRGDELKVIADDLTVSLATVKTHVQRIFAKTKTHRQAELVRLLFAVAS